MTGFYLYFKLMCSAVFSGVPHFNIRGLDNSSPIPVKGRNHLKGHCTIPFYNIRCIKKTNVLKVTAEFLSKRTHV